LSKYSNLIRYIPDFPHKGIMFRDITPLLGDSRGFNSAIKDMAYPFINDRIDFVVAVEARGYIFGAPIAQELQCGFVPVRKQGKLPWDTSQIEYSLEYGSAILEIHKDAIKPGKNVLIVDDVLATGGTLEATIKLIQQAEGNITGIAVLINLIGLHPADTFDGYKFVSILDI